MIRQAKMRGNKSKGIIPEENMNINKAIEKTSLFSKPAVVVGKFFLALGSYAPAVLLLCTASVF